MNCTTVLLVKTAKDAAEEQPRVAYVAWIEDSGKDTLYLRLNSAMVEDYGLESSEKCEFEVQFQLNRIPICEMHYAVDQLPSLGLVYPEVRSDLVIPWSPSKQWWSDTQGGSQLNPKQKEAIVAITTDVTQPLPPILIIGES